MTTSQARLLRDDSIVKGYLRMDSIIRHLNIPSDIASLIFMFYHFRIFHFEYSNYDIEIKENTIKNKSDSSLNTVLIGPWMTPESKQNHTIKVRIDRITGKNHHYFPLFKAKC